MKRKIWTVVGLFVSILLLTPLVVSAQNLDVAPLSWDFGNIELGTSHSQIFTLTSLGPTGVWVYETELAPAVSDWRPSQICARDVSIYLSPLPFYPGGYEVIASDFAITQVSDSDGAGLLPGEYPMGQTVDVQVTFTPSALECRQVFLYVWSNDSVYPPGPYAYISLTGCGVETPSLPGELMSDLLTFFDASVTGGSLLGSGSGSSAPHRLKAFKNMLKASSDLIEADAHDLACTQLQDALDRTDGATPPPDFVAGTDAEELATKITDVMNALTCP